MSYERIEEWRNGWVVLARRRTDTGRFVTWRKACVRIAAHTKVNYVTKKGKDLWISGFIETIDRTNENYDEIAGKLVDILKEEIYDYIEMKFGIELANTFDDLITEGGVEIEDEEYSRSRETYPEYKGEIYFGYKPNEKRYEEKIKGDID